MATIEAPSQPIQALRRGNQIRLAAVAVKREIREGRLTVAEAIADPRSGPVSVLDLLMAQRKWGRGRALGLLSAKAAADPANRISETRRVRELTERQKALLASWCAS